ncbi:MAG TPA: hypothetical protein VLB51_13485 [Methylomirabilota bacterium]|nr:hypothetical protein [Methylomirabilota bacterium]
MPRRGRCGSAPGWIAWGHCSLLADPAEGDFTPQPGSQLFDRGLVTPSINDGYAGAAPDIGAVEPDTPLFADGVESGTTGAWSVAVP